MRIAGIDAGRVTNIDLVEHDGSLRAQVRIALPTTLYKKLKQDVKVTIQPSLTGTAAREHRRVRAVERRLAERASGAGG